MYEDIKNSAIQQEEFDKDPTYNQRGMIFLFSFDPARNYLRKLTY